jgi:hypothetical protein
MIVALRKGPNLLLTLVKTLITEKLRGGTQLHQVLHVADVCWVLDWRTHSHLILH